MPAEASRSPRSGWRRARCPGAKTRGRRPPWSSLPARAARWRPSCTIGDLVTPETVLGPDGRRHATAALTGLSRRGTLLTTDHVLEDGAAKSRLWLETGALAVDMESAEILTWAAARGARGVVLRGVSDAADRGVPADLARVVGDDGRVHPMRAVTRRARAPPRARRRHGPPLRHRRRPQDRRRRIG